MADATDEQIKDIFKREIEKLRFRCYRASKMEYNQASLYDEWLERLEYFLYWLILVGVIVGLYSHSAFQGTILAAPGLVITLFDAFNKIYCSRKSLDYVPILRARAVFHNNAAAKWEWLQKKSECYLIMLNKPDLPLDTVRQWYEELCKERGEICANVIVQEPVYKKFSNPKTLDKYCKRYKEMNKFLENKLPSLQVGVDEPNDEKSFQEEINCCTWCSFIFKDVCKIFKKSFKWLKSVFSFCRFLLPLGVLLFIYLTVLYCSDSLNPVPFFHKCAITYFFSG